MTYALACLDRPFPPLDSPDWEALVPGVYEEHEPFAVVAAHMQADDLFRLAPADWFGWGIRWEGDSVASIAVRSATVSIPIGENWCHWTDSDHSDYSFSGSLALVALNAGVLPPFPPKWQGWAAFADASFRPLAFFALEKHSHLLQEFSPDWSGWMLRAPDNDTLAHAWVRSGRAIPSGSRFKGWMARGSDGLTVAHVAVSKGVLPSFAADWHGWRARDSAGVTVRSLYYAAASKSLSEFDRRVVVLLVDGLVKGGLDVPLFLGSFASVESLPRDFPYPPCYIWINSVDGAMCVSWNTPLLKQFIRSVIDSEDIADSDVDVVIGRICDAYINISKEPCNQMCIAISESIRSGSR